MPLGDALEQMSQFATRSPGMSEEERSERATRRRNTEAMKRLGVAAELGIGRARA